MKKKSTLCILLFSGLIGAGLGVGMMAMLARVEGLSNGAELGWYLLALALLYVFFLVEMILHEAGHLIFGLATGWRFVSFRIGPVIWHKGADGSIHRSKFSLAGTGGQCLLAPPPWKENLSFTPYNLGGVAVNLITAALGGLLAWALWAYPIASLICMEAAGIGLILGLTNLIPLPGLAAANDGANEISLRENQEARRALWIQMSIAAAEAEGVPLRDMPEEWFAPMPENAMDNPLVASIAVFRANRLMDALELPAAEQAIRELLQRKEGVLPIYRALLTMDGATCELLDERPGDLTEALGTPVVQQAMKAMKGNPSVLRTQYILALLRDHDSTRASKLLEGFGKAASTYPYPQDLTSERALISRAKEKEAA